MIKRILVGLGGTPFTKVATRRATELGDLHDAQAGLTTVIDTPQGLFAAPQQGVGGHHLRYGETRAQGPAVGLAVDLLSEGSPEPGILDLARAVVRALDEAGTPPEEFGEEAAGLGVNFKPERIQFWLKLIARFVMAVFRARSGVSEETGKSGETPTSEEVGRSSRR